MAPLYNNMSFKKITIVTTGPPQLSAVPNQCRHHCEHIQVPGLIPSRCWCVICKAYSNLTNLKKL